MQGMLLQYILAYYGIIVKRKMPGRDEIRCGINPGPAIRPPEAAVNQTGALPHHRSPRFLVNSATAPYNGKV